MCRNGCDAVKNLSPSLQRPASPCLRCPIKASVERQQPLNLSRGWSWNPMNTKTMGPNLWNCRNPGLFHQHTRPYNMRLPSQTSHIIRVDRCEGIGTTPRCTRRESIYTTCCTRHEGIGTSPCCTRRQDIGTTPHCTNQTIWERESGLLCQAIVLISLTEVELKCSSYTFASLDASRIMDATPDQMVF